MKCRYDVVYSKNTVEIVEHFCREWDETGGCYGTNPNHGLSFEKAKQYVIDFYKKQIEYWQIMNESDYNNPNVPEYYDYLDDYDIDLDNCKL